MTDREMLIKIALDLISLDPDGLLTNEKNILRLLRDNRIVRKDIITGVWSINPDAAKSS
jgi:hypothetical protein